MSGLCCVPHHSPPSHFVPRNRDPRDLTPPSRSFVDAPGAAPRRRNTPVSTANSKRDSPAAQDVAARIRAARAYADLSREELAKRFGGAISSRLIRRLERGETRPSEAQLMLFASSCGLPPGFFTADFGVLDDSPGTISSQLDAVVERVQRVETDLSSLLRRFDEA